MTGHCSPRQPPQTHPPDTWAMLQFVRCAQQLLSFLPFSQSLAKENKPPGSAGCGLPRWPPSASSCPLCPCYCSCHQTSGEGHRPSPPLTPDHGLLTCVLSTQHLHPGLLRGPSLSSCRATWVQVSKLPVWSQGKQALCQSACRPYPAPAPLADLPSTPHPSAPPLPPAMCLWLCSATPPVLFPVSQCLCFGVTPHPFLQFLQLALDMVMRGPHLPPGLEAA